MFGRDWRSRIAFGLVALALILLGAFLLAPYVPLDLESYPGPLPTARDFQTPECGYPEAQATYDDAAKQRDDPRRARIPAWHEHDLREAKIAERAKEKAAECEERQRRQWDLAAQWHSAVAAGNVARIAENQRFWGVSEFILLIGAFLTALYAAGQARSAARQSQRSADAAEQSLRGLERPYLFVEIEQTNFLRVVSPNRTASMNYAIKNYGKLPAIMRSLSVSLRYNPSFPLLSTDAISEESYAIVQPGKYLFDAQENWIRGLEVIDASLGQSFYGNGATLLVLHGILEYEDPTGAYHVDSFCLRGMTNAESFRIDESVQEYNWHRTTYPRRQQDNQT